MKTRITALLLALVLCVGLCACTPSDWVEGRIEKQVKELVSAMSVEQKLAQMMIVSLRTDSVGEDVTQIAPEYAEFLGRYDFGGVILYASNIVDAAQTVRFIRDCQTAALGSALGVPMFVSVDQEGGLVNRVSYGTVGAGSMALAATGDTALTEECARLFGEELQALGFNLDFAPVSDVNNNPNNPVIGVRSFSDDPQIVSEHVKAFLAGLAPYNVSAALKHFPGHGNVDVDSHTGLPSSELTLSELKACELIPFQAGIAAGAEMIMTAHIQFPQIERGTYVSKEDGREVCLPATLSRTIMTDVLRGELGYEGIIITDAMVMSAIAAHFDKTDAAVLAINAGIDILLCPVELYKDEKVDNFAVMDEYMQNLLARVASGEIPEEELDDSVTRILKLKYRKGIMTDTLRETEEAQLEKAKAVVGSPAHHEREWAMAERAVTLLRNEGETLPVNGAGARTLLLVPNRSRLPGVEYAISRLEKAGRLDAAAVTTMVYADLKPDDADLLAAVRNAERVLILSQSAAGSELVRRVIDETHRNGGKAALLSINLPYDAACYEDADAILCAYNPYGKAFDAQGNGPFNLNVAVAVCAAFGETIPGGTLPVNVPKRITDAAGKSAYADEILFPRGYGLKNWGRD